jgi:hypothetical protein
VLRVVVAVCGGSGQQRTCHSVGAYLSPQLAWARRAELCCGWWWRSAAGRGNSEPVTLSVLAGIGDARARPGGLMANLSLYSGG